MCVLVPLIVTFFLVVDADRDLVSRLFKHHHYLSVNVCCFARFVVDGKTSESSD